jgi:hypothetical protein
VSEDDRRDSLVDLSRERSVRAILHATLEFYRAFPLLFLILAAAVIVPYDLAVLAATGHGPFGLSHTGFVVSQLLNVLSFSLISPLISALHVHAVVMIGESRRPRLPEVATVGLRVLPVVSAAEIVANIGILLGTLALILPGILLALRWSVVAQSAAVEHDGWLAALRRSRTLTAGHYGHIFGLGLVVGALALGVRLAAIAISFGHTSSVPSVALGLVVDTILASFSALTLAILYFDLRARETDLNASAGDAAS